MKGTHGDNDTPEDDADLPVTSEDVISLAHVRLTTIEGRQVIYRIKKECGYIDLLKIGDDYCKFAVRPEMPFGNVDLTIGIHAEPLNFDERYGGMVSQSKIGSHAEVQLNPSVLAHAVEGLFSEHDSPRFGLGMLTLITIELECARSDEVLEWIIDSYHNPRKLGHYNVLLIHLWGILSRYYNCSKTCGDLVLSVAEFDKALIEKRLAKIFSTMGILKNTTHAVGTKKFLLEFERDAAKNNGKLNVFFREEIFDSYNYEEYHQDPKVEQKIPKVEQIEHKGKGTMSYASILHSTTTTKGSSQQVFTPHHVPQQPTSSIPKSAVMDKATKEVDRAILQQGGFDGGGTGNGAKSGHFPSDRGRKSGGRLGLR